MGLFDRWKAPQDHEEDRSPTVPDVPAEPDHQPIRVVPDLDDDAGPFSDAVREHLERLTAAADSDIASLEPGAFDAALTSRLVGAERIQSTGLGFAYASPVRRPHPRGAHPRPALCRRHASRLPHRRVGPARAEPGQPRSQQPHGTARGHPGRRRARLRGRAGSLHRHRRQSLHGELRPVPQRRGPPLAARRRRQQRVGVRPPLPPRDRPPALLDPGRGARRPRARAGLGAADARRRREPGVGAHLPLGGPADHLPDRGARGRQPQRAARRRRSSRSSATAAAPPADPSRTAASTGRPARLSRAGRTT